MSEEIKKYQIVGFPKPDWTQNDETAKNYIANRTHYIPVLWSEECVVDPTGVETTDWSGTCSVGYLLDRRRKIGDPCYVSIYFDDVLYERCLVSSDGRSHTLVFGDSMKCFKNQSMKFDPKTGVYQSTVDTPQELQQYVTKVTHVRYECVDGDFAVPLHEAYIPSTIARVSDIPAAVEYDTAQSLTEEQQAQARMNIGISDIITPDMVLALMNEVGAATPIADSDGYVITTNDDEILIL